MNRSFLFSILAIVTLVVGLLLPAAAPAYWAQNGNWICQATNTQRLPKIVADGVGGAICSWIDMRSSPGYDIYAERVDSLGVSKWNQYWGVAVSAAADSQWYQDMIPDGAGGAFIVWQDHRNDSQTAADIYAQRLDGSGNRLWEPDDGVPICALSNNQTWPRLVSDGAGGAIITWDDYRAGNWDVYAQRVNGSGDTLWAANGVVVSDTVGSQYAPHIAQDGSGGAIIMWEDLRNGYPDIYAQRVNASGSRVWQPANGVVICGDAAIQEYDGNSQAITSDGAGGAIICWFDARSGLRVYAQRVDSSGSVLWQANGLPVCTSGYGAQVNPEICPDGAGGAVIAWWETPVGGGDDIYAQRMNSSGTLLWSSGGAPVCTESHTQYDFSLTPDGSGGAIVEWSDDRNASGGYGWQIYAQRLKASDGSKLWAPTDGLPICTVGDSFYPAITSDTHGGAIMAWMDGRLTGGANICGARAWAEGSTVGYGTPVSGTLSGNATWTGVKVVSADVTVASGDTLTLSPNCLVRFASNEDYGKSGIDTTKCELIVNGVLSAVGNEDYLVWLKDASTTSGQTRYWYGIRLGSASSEDELSYCYITNASHAVELTECTATIHHCAITKFDHGIKATDAAVTIDDNGVLLGTVGDTGIELAGQTSGTVSYTYVLGTDNTKGCGIETGGSASPVLSHNVITGMNLGIRCTGESSPEISCDSISTYGGISCQDDAQPIVRNTTVRGFAGTGVGVSDNANPDLGTTSYHGNNRFIPAVNFTFYVANVTENTVWAEENWWGKAEPISNKFCGDVDYEPHLTSDPGPQYVPPIVESPLSMPSLSSVRGIYPNPGPRATIDYTVGAPESHVGIVVYDISGRVVKVLVNEAKPMGRFTTAWDGRSERGERVAPGIYLYEVAIGDFRQTGKLVLIR